MEMSSEPPAASHVDDPPVSPSPHMEDLPVSPTSYVEDLPVSPSSHMEDLPMSPTSSHTEELLVSPSSHMEDLPVSPSPHMEDLPVSASSHMEELPVSPTSQMEDLPVSPSSHMEELSVSASSHVEELPVSSSPHLKDLPVSPASHMDDLPVSPSPHMEDLPVSPSSHMEDLPVSPASHMEELSIAPVHPASSPVSSSSASSFAGEDEATEKLPPAASLVKPLDPAIDEDVDGSYTTTGNGNGLVSALGRMKDRAATAKKTLRPQLSISNIKDKTSKKLDKYQPTIDKAKSSATAGLTTAACRVKEGSTHGWSMFKTKLAAAGPAAERFHAMGLHVMTDIYHGDTAVDMLECVEDSKSASCHFVYKYKTGNVVAESPSKAIGLLRRTRVIGKSHSTVIESASPATRCFATPYVLGTILLFCGDLSVLARMSRVNKVCRDFIASEHRFEKFCVRYGHLSPRFRCAYWVKTAKVRKLRNSGDLDYNTYLQMAMSKGDVTESIMTDVHRTYGRVAPHKRAANHKDQESNEELTTQLSEILHALAGRFPAVGYCQGLDYIAAHILDKVKKSKSLPDIKAEAESTFWLLVTLFEKYGLHDMFAPGLHTLHVHCFQTRRLLELSKPALAEHLAREKVPIEMFAVGWFQTMYLYLNVLPPESLDRIWDIFIFEKNWKIMLRVALALLQLSEEFVMDKPIDEITQFFNTFADKADEVLAEAPLIERALRLKVTNAVLTKLQKQHVKLKRGSPTRS